MEETLAIPNTQERCINLRSIILFILPRLDDTETALSLVKQARNEFAQLGNIIDRTKYLFAACEMLLQLNDLEEATATLEEVTETLPETPAEPSLTHSDDDNLISDATVLQQMLDDGVAEIKLDNTLEDRALFRSLLNAIKETGNYKFSPNGQKWILREQAE